MLSRTETCTTHTSSHLSRKESSFPSLQSLPRTRFRHTGIPVPCTQAQHDYCTRQQLPEASRGPEPQTALVKFLTPTPPGFQPEIDYTSTLRALSEAAAVQTAGWSILLEEIDDKQLQWKLLPKVCIIDGAGSTECLTVSPEDKFATKEEAVTWMYRQIQAIRQRMATEAQQRTCVLVA
jgi:hypothetical protein